MTKRDTRVWGSPPCTRAEVRSVQVLERYARGAVEPWPPGHEVPPPSPHDVKRVLDWIIHKAAMTYENGTFVKLAAGVDDPDLPPFIDGRRFVGKELTKLMSLKPESVPE